MIEQHEVFSLPDDEQKIWRYMDFACFVSFLITSSLFFRRADKFKDTLEGSYSRFNIKSRGKVYKEWDEENRDIALQQMSDAQTRIRSYIYINCWHINTRESSAMWDAYSSSAAGIALQSTVCRLKAEMKASSRQIHIGEVHCIDYDETWMPEGNLFWPYVHKDESFRHENELRCVYADFPNFGEHGKPESEFGLEIQCDLNNLVESIYIAPYAPDWFKEMVSALVTKYGVDFRVSQSKMSLKAVY
jgi:hypothetical protein